MRQGFWREADQIIKASRASHPGYSDVEHARWAREAEERRKAEMIADGTLPDPQGIKVPRA